MRIIYMKKIQTIITLCYCLIIILAPINIVFASSYQYEVGYRYDKSEDGSNLKTRLNTLGGSYFFLPVENGNEPYAESDFLQQIGSISLVYGKGNFDLDPISNIDASIMAFDYLYAMPATSWVVDVSVTTLDLSELPNGFDGTSDSFNIGIGNYVGYGHLIGLEMASTSTKSDVFGASILDTDKIEYIAFFKFVDKIYNNYINVEGSLASSNVDNSIDKEANVVAEVGANIYINTATSVGANYSINTGDDTSLEGTEYTVGVDIYLTEGLSVSFDYGSFTADNSSGEDVENYSLAATLRK